MTEQHETQDPLVTLRFYAELNDFLPQSRRFCDFKVTMPPHTTVKHLVESLGAPHTEIDLILVNGASVDFHHIPQHADRISVYPVFESFDISPVIRLRPEPLRTSKFIADAHLGKLAIFLRMLGFDTLYQNDFEDHEMAVLSHQEQRIILTRDRGLLKRNQVTHGVYIHSTQPRQQLAEIIQRLQLSAFIQPFQRCLECNRLLQNVQKEQILESLPARTRERYDEFQKCPGCLRIYWKGTHYHRMQKFIEEVMA
jgi:uncharacterized protein with PIN domain